MSKAPVLFCINATVRLKLVGFQPHTVILIDALSGEPVFDGRPVSVTRLIRFYFPAAHAIPDVDEVSQLHHHIDGIRVGMFLAVSPRTSQFHRVYISLVTRVFRDQNQVMSSCTGYLSETAQDPGKLAAGVCGLMREGPT